jgi:hypothetical protein
MDYTGGHLWDDKNYNGETKVQDPQLGIKLAQAYKNRAI